MREVEILIVTVVFALCHAIAPRAFELSARMRREVSSFSGGLAAAYVFLHLLPEIDEAGELLGPRIYFVTLVGLATFYGLEVLIHRLRANENQNVGEGLHLAAAAMYSALLVFTLGHQLPTSFTLTLVFAATMGLHLLSSDFGLLENYGQAFVRHGRWVLVFAVLAGFGLSLVRDPREEVTDVVTALLAGFMMFNVFRTELPELRDAHLRAFLLGAGAFLGAHVVLSAAG